MRSSSTAVSSAPAARPWPPLEEREERQETEEREEREDMEKGREDSYLLARAANGAEYSHGGGGGHQLGAPSLHCLALHCSPLHYTAPGVNI